MPEQYDNIVPANLTFATLRKANMLRLPEFKDALGRPAHEKADGSDWSPADWTVAMVGEVGEFANKLKKVRRGDMPLSAAKEYLLQELADIVIYLDILAFQLHIDLDDAIVNTWNAKSRQVGCSLRLHNTPIGTVVGRVGDIPNGEKE